MPNRGVGLYWHRWGGWAMIQWVGPRAYRKARADGWATRWRLWGYVSFSWDLVDNRPRYPADRGLRMHPTAWRDYKRAP